VTISRVNNHITYPANFQLIAAMNPCKCGYFGYVNLQCSRIPKCVQDYNNRISGPLFDRFDIHIEVPEVTPAELEDLEEGEGSNVVLERVKIAKNIQQVRYKELGISSNSELEGQELNKHIILDDQSKEILRAAMLKFRFSMRGRNKVLKVARTIADLAQEQQITRIHIAEALSYRSTTRNGL
jgi:magnesium chelatase family protein